MKTMIDVVAGIIWKDGSYLAVERPEGARMAGWWEFPGGKIEPGESRDQALVRELDEELGISCITFDFWRDIIHHYDEFSVHLHFFHVTEYAGEPSSLEGQRMEWIKPAHPVNLKFLPADIEIVEALKMF